MTTLNAEHSVNIGTYEKTHFVYLLYNTKTNLTKFFTMISNIFHIYQKVALLHVLLYVPNMNSKEFYQHNEIKGHGHHSDLIFYVSFCHDPMRKHTSYELTGKMTNKDQ